MLDVPIGMFIVGFIPGLIVGAVCVFRAWERDVLGLRRALAQSELENVRLNEEADWAAVIARSEHPSLGLVRPVAPVIDFPRRGGA